MSLDRVLTVAVCIVLGAVVVGQLRSRQGGDAPFSESALRARVGVLASDSLRGRRAGTVDNDRATEFIALEMQRAGLEPAGDSGTFFQYVPLSRRMLPDSTQRVSLSGRLLQPFVDYIPRNNGAAAHAFDGALSVYAGEWNDSVVLRPDEIRGRIVVIATPPGQVAVVKTRAEALYALAAAIAIVNLDSMAPAVRRLMASSPVPSDTSVASVSVPSYMHISAEVARRIFGSPHTSLQPGATGSALTGAIRFNATTTWARNVVGILRGSDTALSAQYVALGAHNDHEGVDRPLDADSVRAFNLQLRALQLAQSGEVSAAATSGIAVNMDSIRKLHPVPRLDSIYNGADDNASGTVVLLETARAMAGGKVRPRRSVLFVSHTAEEQGLTGSQWFTEHPPVSLDSIVAHINLDMVGRGRAGEEKNGGPQYLQLIGSRRLSSQLGDLVEQVSRDRNYNWEFDYQFDADGHPEQYYCRSDHFMYARFGIPVVFMSTGNHADYHQVTDELQYIDFAKLGKVGRFVADVTLALANRDTRVAVDKPRPDPAAACVQ